MSLLINHPLAAEINLERNFEVPTDKLTLGSNRKIWWKCSKSHEWEATVNNRVQGKGCPACSGRKVLHGFNDLTTTHPKLSLEWNQTKNLLSPTEVTAGSKQKAWWLDEYGHEWEAVINSRSNPTRPVGCPYCANKAVLVGFNDLASLYPLLSDQLHPTKNGSFSGKTLVFGSNQKMWWICNEGHEWRTSVVKRVSDNSGCPVCIGQQVQAGFNDLSTTNPILAAQWHPTRNDPLKPSEIQSCSNKKVWWLCSENHEWQATVNNRSTLTRGCPYCSNQSIQASLNDFATLHPILAAEWHPTKNGSLSASTVSSGTDKKIWFVCDQGHEWETSLHHRTGTKRTGCPNCANLVSKQEVEVADFLKDLGMDVVTSDRKTIKPFELDILITEKKFAVEFNGLRWHTEAYGKGREYHHNKWKACQKQGIQLIQIWEDEWNHNSEQVKRMLAHKLGFSTERKIFARATSITEVDKTEAKIFLESNHIQGFASGSYYLGLIDSDNQLSAVLVLKKEAKTHGRTLNIIRYATSANVVGGFTKLLKHAENLYQPESFISFSDHCVSDGGLYENNGFVADKELPPDYMYVVGGERQHKFGYRLKRFRNDSNLLWEEGLTERELALLNNIPRIWDAGKTRWLKRVIL